MATATKLHVVTKLQRASYCFRHVVRTRSSSQETLVLIRNFARVHLATCWNARNSNDADGECVTRRAFKQRVKRTEINVINWRCAPANANRHLYKHARNYKCLQLTRRVVHEWKCFHSLVTIMFERGRNKVCASNTVR